MVLFPSPACMVTPLVYKYVVVLSEFSRYCLTFNSANLWKYLVERLPKWCLNCSNPSIPRESKYISTFVVSSNKKSAFSLFCSNCISRYLLRSVMLMSLFSLDRKNSCISFKPVCIESVV